MTGSEAIDIGDDVVQARVAAVTDGFWNSRARRSARRPPPAGHDGVVFPHAFFERWFRGNASVIGRPVLINGQQTITHWCVARQFSAAARIVARVCRARRRNRSHRRLSCQRHSPGGGTRDPDPECHGPLEARRVDRTRTRGTRKPARTAAAGRHGSGSRSRAGSSHGSRKAFAISSSRRALRRQARWRRTASCSDPARCRALVLSLDLREHRKPIARPRRAARQRESRSAWRSAPDAGVWCVSFLSRAYLLAMAGGVLGLLVARAADAVVLGLIPRAVPRLVRDHHRRIRVTVFALASAVTTVVFAFAPAIALWKNNISDSLKDAARSASSSTWSFRVRRRSSRSKSRQRRPPVAAGLMVRASGT